MSNRIFYCLIVFLLFLLQFVYYPFGASFFEAPKVYVAELIIFILLLLQIFKGKWTFIQQKKSLVIVATVIVLLSIVDLLFFRFDYTFWGNPFRMQGILLLWFLLLFSYLASFEPIKRINPFFIFGVLFIQFVLSFMVESGSLERAIGSVGEPNSLAAVMVFVWPFFYFSFKKKHWRFLAFIVSIVLVGLTILFSGSRSGMIAFAIQLLFFFGVEVFRGPIKLMTVLCVLLLFCSFAFPFLEQGSVYENRGEVWQTAFFAGLEQPLFGHGFGNTEYALHPVTIKMNNHLQGYYVDSSHNIFLDWWVQGGIIGFGLLLFLVYSATAHFVKQKESRNLLVFLGLVTALCFNPASVVLLVQFWWLIGQSYRLR